ncbi:MAG: GerMN domain-containing protein [Bacillota bacterium]|jgi:spore germination protein GerM
MKKKSFPSTILVVLLLIVLGIAAWLVWRNTNPDTTQPPGVPGTDQSDDSSREDEAAVEITLYFANDRYIQTGDVNEPQVLPEKRTVRPGDRSLPETVMAELISGPDTAGLSSVLSNLKVRSVEVRDGIAYVDFSGDNLHGGSLSESLLIEQTVRSLTALKGVEAVQFLVNGEKTESLMGHILVIDPVYP